MFKNISIAVLCCMAFSCHALQSRQEIVDYCKNLMLNDGGNVMVLQCIKMELEAQGRIQEFMKK